MFVNVCTQPSTESFATMKSLANESIDGWKDVVLSYDKIANNYYEKTKDEMKWIRDVARLIDDTLPEQFKTGVHLLFAQRSFMGEDIYVFEGHITTTIHCSHSKCKEYKVLNWNRLYCAACKEDISRDDCVFT